MPLDWTSYDAFDWAASQQTPLTLAERATLAEMVAGVLHLASEEATVWGQASPPGRYAATVVQVSRSLLSPSWGDVPAGLPWLGVKVFKTTADARREAEKILSFHQHQLHRLPGLPHPRVQRSLGVGQTQGRVWILLEWFPGVGLDCWRAGFSKSHPADLAVVRSLLEQFLGEIVLPLWSVGLIWWDFREANCCVDPTTNQLYLLDVDSLAAYAGEILTTPTLWTQREKGRGTAEARLRNMTWRLLQTAGQHGKRATEAFRSAWNEQVAPILATIGQTMPLEVAQDRFKQFLNRTCPESE